MSSDRDRYRDLGPQYADYEDEPPRPAISPGKVTRTSRLASPRRSRGPVAPGKRTLASRIPAAPRGGDALPYRAQMESLFGEDFSGVHVATNQAEELAPMGARAAAEGETIRFASSKPEPSLVAHELTHVVQQRHAGETALAAKKDESDPSDAAEREADEVAARVERLGTDAPPVVVRAQPTARVHFHRNGPPAHPENIARNRAAAKGAANLTSVERGEALLTRAQSLCKEVPSALLPAYRNAVDALDMMAAIELSHAIVTAVDEVLTAHLEIDRAFPSNAPERWNKSTDNSPDGETEADIRGKWARLRKQKAALEPDTLAMKQAVAMQIGPRIFRGRPVMGGVESLPALHGAGAQSHRLAHDLEPSAGADSLIDQLENHLPLLGSVSSSSSPQIAWTFFLSTMSAAASASALSLRNSSFSSSRMRLASGDTFARRRLPNTSGAAFVSCSRHCSSCASCSPLRRKNSPRSSSRSAPASSTTCSFASALQSWGRLPLVPARAFFVFFLFDTAGTVPACLSQRDSVACGTPASSDNQVALLPFGPAIFWTIFSLNDSEYLTDGPSPPPVRVSRVADPARPGASGAHQKAGAKRHLLRAVSHLPGAPQKRVRRLSLRDN